MNIILNNNEESFDANELTINQILNIKKYSFRMLVIKINNNLVAKDKYDSQLVKDGDKLDIIHLMSGG